MKVAVIIIEVLFMLCVFRMLLYISAAEVLMESSSFFDGGLRESRGLFSPDGLIRVVPVVIIIINTASALFEFFSADLQVARTVVQQSFLDQAYFGAMLPQVIRIVVIVH